MTKHVRSALCAVLAVALLASQALAVRTQLKPGWNMFSKQQEVQLGREAAAEAERQLVLVRDPTLNNYIQQLGRRLAAHSPASDYPYTFKVVQDKSINAFALPGGPVYVNTGTIAAAQNEAQLAGVIAHEIGHVTLRHATSNASKAMLAQAPLAILGGLIGSGSMVGQLAQLGIGFGLNSIFLKYSRDAERQADIMGAQIMYDSGYDPEQMAQFFQTLETKERSRSVDFLSDHPSPGNRVEIVRREEQQLGPLRNEMDDSAAFQRARSVAQQVSNQAPSRNSPGYMDQPTGQHQHATFPSGRFQMLDAGVFRMGYPDNWQVFGQGTSAVTIAPSNGLVKTQNGPSLAYGVMISVYEPESGEDSRRDLSGASADLVEQLRQANPGLRVLSGRQRVTVAGQQGMSITLVNRSPVAGNEVDWLVTTPLADGTLWYAIFVAPEQDFRSLRPTYVQMLDSLQLAR